MKKIFLIIMLIIFVSNTYALELTYSDWDSKYPTGLDPKFIEQEDRFHWYKDNIVDVEYLKIEDIGEKLYDKEDIKYFESEKLLERPEEYSEREIKVINETKIYTEDDVNGISIKKVDGISIYEVVIKDVNDKLIVDDMTNTEEDIYIRFQEKYNVGDLQIFVFFSSVLEEEKNITINLINDVDDRIYFTNYKISGVKDDYLIINSSVLNSDLIHNKEYYIYIDKLYKTYNINREYIDEYYTQYDGYEKDENSVKTFYRYITNDYVFLNYKGDIVKSKDYCSKHVCKMLYVNPSKNNTVENPKTGDHIYKYIILFYISLFSILIYIVKKCRTNKLSSFVESI